MEIAVIHQKHRVCKITTVGSTFILKDISDAPNLTRLAFTRAVLTQVVRTGLRVPIPLLTRSAQPALAFQGQAYLLAEFIEAGEYPPEPECRAELFYQTGQAIAKLHQARPRIQAQRPAATPGAKTWQVMSPSGLLP